MRKTTHLILCALFAALIAVGAFIKIPTPVPITLQTLFVLLSGMLLGAKGGAISCLVYIAIGLAGLPVFTKGGGMMYLLEPTFGYLLGFVPCAWIVGRLVERMHTRTFLRLFFAAFLGICIIYVIGVLYWITIGKAYFSESADTKAIIVSGVFLCLPSDVLLCVVCAWISKKIHLRLSFD